MVLSCPRIENSTTRVVYCSVHMRLRRGRQSCVASNGPYRLPVHLLMLFHRHQGCVADNGPPRSRQEGKEEGKGNQGPIDLRAKRLVNADRLTSPRMVDVPRCIKQTGEEEAR
jgi:hypothetical protein